MMASIDAQMAEAARAHKSVLDMIRPMMPSIEAQMAEAARAHKSMLDMIWPLSGIQSVFDTLNNKPRQSPAIIQRPRHLVLVDELKELPREQRVDALLGLLKEFAPELERLDSGLLVVHTSRVEHYHFYGVQNPLASIEQTQQEKEELPIGADLLTHRQNEIAHLLADGMDDRAIADHLTISKNTVRKHREDIGERWKTSGALDTLHPETRRRGYGQA
jgi:hypothetical protein